MAAALKKTWFFIAWMPRGFLKALGNEVSAFGQVMASQEAIARAAKLESEGKNPLKVARQEYVDMWLACQPYRLRSSVAEWEKLKSNVMGGKIDLQEVMEIIYLVVVFWLLYKLGESVGRGSFYGYRFDGAEHRAEAQRAEEFKKKEAEESAKAFAKIEAEIQAWIAKMEAENK